MNTSNCKHFEIAITGWGKKDSKHVTYALCLDCGQKLVIAEATEDDPDPAPELAPAPGSLASGKPNWTPWMTK